MDLLSWITAQPWSDGRVVLYGWSYVGQSFWLILGAGHPAVRAASIASPFTAAVDLPLNGVPNFMLARCRAGLVGRGTSYESNSDAGIWAQEITEALASDLPIWADAQAFGVPYDERLARHLQTPDPGPAWSRYVCRDDEVAAITVPVLAVGGAHDDCSPGTFHQWPGSSDSRRGRRAPAVICWWVRGTTRARRPGAAPWATSTSVLQRAWTYDSCAPTGSATGRAPASGAWRGERGRHHRLRFCARELGRGSRLRLTVRAAWSPLILPASDGLTSHPAVTLALVHRATDPAVLTLPLGTTP